MDVLLIKTAAIAVMLLGVLVTATIVHIKGKNDDFETGILTFGLAAFCLASLLILAI